MFFRPFYLLFLLGLTSCALFRNEVPLDQDTEKLLQHLQVLGEGRGRLGIKEQQHLFSYDAILKENSDWLLAVNIPLHGEEVLMLKDLKTKDKHWAGEDSLGSRIEHGISVELKTGSPLLARQFLDQMRSMIRLALHKELNKEVRCTHVENVRSCEMEGEIYQISSDPKQLLIKKAVSQDHRIELIAENLTGPFFSKMSFYLREEKRPGTLLSLELFWK